jgi:hypothetical protein
MHNEYTASLIPSNSRVYSISVSMNDFQNSVMLSYPSRRNHSRARFPSSGVNLAAIRSVGGRLDAAVHVLC